MPEVVGSQQTQPGMPTNLGRRRRLQLVVVLVGVLALVVVAGFGGVYWHTSATYAAPRWAGYYGPQPGRPTHVTQGDDILSDYRMIGSRGTTQYFEWGLINDGDHDVTITGAAFVSSQTLQGERVLGQLDWSPYREDPSRLVNGLPAPSHTFPASLPAHGQINIRVRVTKPSCSSVPAGVLVGVSENITVHWKAMISSHTTEVGPHGTIALC